MLCVWLLMVAAQVSAASGGDSLWTLRGCLQYATVHNISVRQSIQQFQAGYEDTRQARAQLFPSFNAAITQEVVGYPYHRTTNTDAYAGSYGVSASWTFFNGNRNRIALKQQSLQDDSNRFSVRERQNDIRIAVIQAYLQIMYAREAVRINEQTVEVSLSQRTRSQHLLEAGSISRVDFAQIESQYNADRYALVEARNTLATYELQLKQLLELDIRDSIDITAPALGEDDVMMPLESKTAIYDQALAAMPQIQGAQLNTRVADLELSRAKGGYWPELSLSADMGARHTSVSGDAFGYQLRNGLNASAGLTVSIPIFRNRSVRTEVNKATIAVVDSRLAQMQTEKDLLAQVENAWLDASAAQARYIAAREKQRSAAVSYDLTEQQFFLGMKNTLEMLTEKNNYLSAQQEVLQAKYTAVMNRLLLDVYQGREINVDY